MLAALKALDVIPVGYVESKSALVLRTLELVSVPEEVIAQWYHSGCKPFAPLSDGQLFSHLQPGERTGLFASASALNRRFAEAGHEIVFFYANMSHRQVPGQPAIARIELPCWATGLDTVNTVHEALYSQCQLASYPFVLLRAHELAVISAADKRRLDLELAAELLREGIWAMPSAKARAKDLLRRK